MNAQAYLLERLGDVEAALDIYTKQLETSTGSLVHALLSGTTSINSVALAVRAKGFGSRLLGQNIALQSSNQFPPEVMFLHKPTAAQCLLTVR